MFDNILKLFKKFGKKDPEELTSKEMAKERLHLVLMQDRANVSADFLDMMRQEIIDVIKKYIDVDEKDIDVRLTNKMNDDGTNGAPALYANIPIAGVKQNLQSTSKEDESKEENKEKSEKEINQEEDKKEEKKLEENKNDEKKSEEKIEEKSDKDSVSDTVKKEKKEPNKTKSNTKKNTKSTKKQKT